MLAIVHIIFGAAIGKAIAHPWIAATVAFISHYILDAVPHYNPHEIKGFHKNGLKGIKWRELGIKSIEPLLAIVLLMYLVLSNSESYSTMLIGAFFSWLPDLMIFISWQFGSNHLHRMEIVWHKHAPFPHGVIVQVIVLILAITYLLA